MTTKKGLSRRIREVAQEKYIKPALRAGLPVVSVRVSDLMEDLRNEGIPPEKNTPQFCSAIQLPTFLSQNGLEIENVEGPRSKQSTTVVVHYRILGTNPTQKAVETKPEDSEVKETSEEWARRLTGKLRGLLKEELAEYGGGEAFLKWMRSEDEDEEAA